DVVATTQGSCSCDGRPPILSAVLILLSLGDGGFRTPTKYPLNPTSMRIADFDGDGSPDLGGVESSTFCDSFSGSGAVLVLLNRGDGTFEVRLREGVECSPFSLYVADFDSDGSPDIFTVCSSGVVVFLNSGHGNFAVGTTSTSFLYSPTTL